MWVMHAAVLYVPAVHSRCTFPPGCSAPRRTMGHGRPSDEAAGGSGRGGAPEVTGPERAQVPFRNDL